MIVSVDSRPFVKRIYREGEGRSPSPRVFMGESSSVGEGCEFRVFAADEEEIHIGEDCAIADNVFMLTNWGSHFMEPVRSWCKGSIGIGDHVWVGRGAMIRGDLAVGDWAVIGMGAVVTKNVAPFHVVAGNPARDLGLRKDINAIIRSSNDTKGFEVG